MIAPALVAALALWQTAPAPAAMPPPDDAGDLAIDDFTLHYQVFGAGDPVVLLHGGLGAADDWADEVPALAAHHRVIAIDSRGHGRSTLSAHGLSYALMAGDVIALLDHLGIDRAAIVGWSDGGVVGLELAIHHPDRVSRLFVLGTNYALAGMKPSNGARTMTAYFAHARAQYARLAPAPGQLAALMKDLRAMWAGEPRYTDDQLRAIAVPVTVALGDHDEIIRRAHVERLAALVPGARLAILAGVSHLAPWQDPDQLDRALLEFLAADR